MTDHIKIAQRLDGAWIIDIDNPFEDYCRTELAVFHQDNPTIRLAVASTAISLSATMQRPIKVESHIHEHIVDMEALVDLYITQSHRKVPEPIWNPARMFS